MPVGGAWYKVHTPENEGFGAKRPSKMRKLSQHCNMKIKENPLNPPERESSYYPLKREGTLVQTIKAQIGNMKDIEHNASILSPIFFSQRSELTQRSIHNKRKFDPLDKPRMRLDKIQDVWDPRSNISIPMDSLDTSLFGHHFKPISRMDSNNTNSRTPRRLPPIRQDTTLTQDSNFDISHCGAPSNTPAPEHDMVRHKKVCLCLRCREKLAKH